MHCPVLAVANTGQCFSPGLGHAGCYTTGWTAGRGPCSEAARRGRARGSSMMQWHGRLWLLVLAAILSSVGTPTLAQQQALCAGGANRAVDACALGMPDAHGVTLRAALDDFGQTRSYQFDVGPGARTGYIYVGDLWYELSATLLRQVPAPNAAADARPVADVRVAERRTIQF